MNEPVADSLRSILDGHLVLSRHLAHEGQYPALDVLRSASRLLPDLTSKDEQALIADAVKCLALLDRNRQLVDIGAYEKGANPALDRALELAPALRQWLSQDQGGVERSVAMKELSLALWPDRVPVGSESLRPTAAQNKVSYAINGKPPTPSKGMR
jgi:flagellum-specific ATP synthase